ncbi:hypothetical protein OSTOST_11692, partial [Ostertagia ostertagi]
MQSVILGNMVHANTTNDLELVLDRIPIEYPALVMETFLSIGKNEIRDDCASLADGYCWMVSKHSVFVWSTTAADAAVVTISPSCMNCFNVDKKGLAWTVNTRTFLEGYVTAMTRFDGGAPADVEWFSVIPVGSSHTNDFKVSACEAMKHLLSKNDADLTVLVYAFLKTMIDQQ